jgi:hypothetical protein
MSMIRTFCTAAVLGLLATPAIADVTVTAQVAAKGGETESITYIKGLKMRSDSSVLGTPTTTIVDVEAQKFISINHKKKEVVVYDLAKFREDLGKSVNSAAAVASLKPNSERREIAGKACVGYDMSMTMPMALGQGAPEMTMMMSGPVFIAKGAPGSADYARFHNAAAEKGFVMSDPRAAKANPQAQGMTHLYKAIADTGGIPYYMEMSVKIDGGGPMGGMMNKMMGGAAFTQTVTAVSTDVVPDDKFALPADYKVKDAK